MQRPIALRLFRPRDAPRLSRDTLHLRPDFIIILTRAASAMHCGTGRMPAAASRTSR